MPICFAELHKNFTIVRISGNDKIRKHLTSLGFVPGETVMVINKINNNVIVKIKGVSLAISEELSRRIFI